MIGNIKRLGCPIEDIRELFEYIAEGDGKTITKEKFANLMSDMEKVVEN